TASSESKTSRMPRKNSSPERREQALDCLLEEAIGCKKRRDFGGALRALSAAVEKFPESATAWGLLGGGYLYETAEPKKAIPCFERATRLSPRSETASLGLFHSLWEAGRRTRAIAEMNRFQTVSHSEDYAEIAAELKAKGVCA